MGYTAKHIAIATLRRLVGAVFLFSGVVKCVDPVGTSLFVEKYLTTYSLDVLHSVALHIAITLAVVEFVVGTMLILRSCYYYLLRFVTILIVLFTVVTLLSATILPIDDCGCFGDAVKLSPWGTFIKNVALLTAILLLYRFDDHHRQRVTLRDVLTLCVAAICALGVNVYAYRYLPIIDFLPYKVGVDLRTALANRGTEEYVVVCRNIESGRLCEFSSNDTAWYDGWEVVDTYQQVSADSDFADFMIYDASGNECSGELLSREGGVVWLCVRSVDMLHEYDKKVEHLFEIFPHSRVVAVTSEDISAVTECVDVECYAVDALLLRSIMRAELGVVVLEDGVIIDKRSICDI